MIIDLEALMLAIKLWVAFGVGLYALIGIGDR